MRSPAFGLPSFILFLFPFSWVWGVWYILDRAVEFSALMARDNLGCDLQVTKQAAEFGTMPRVNVARDSPALKVLGCPLFFWALGLKRLGEYLGIPGCPSPLRKFLLILNLV